MQKIDNFLEFNFGGFLEFPHEATHITTYSDRAFDFESSSYKFLEKRFSRNKIKSKFFLRKKNLPHINSVQPIYGKALVLNINDVVGNQSIVGILKINYDKMQLVKKIGNVVWILGASTLACFDVESFKGGGQKRIEPKLFIQNRLLAGSHSFELKGNSIFVSSSGAEGVLEFDCLNGKLLKSYLFGGLGLTRSYRVTQKTDLVKNYVTNRHQKFHLNSVTLFEDKIFFSTLSGVIGYFETKTRKTKILATGYVGIHSLKFDNVKKHLHFISSTTGEFICIDMNGSELEKFAIESKWVQGARSIESCNNVIFSDTYNNRMVVAKKFQGEVVIKLYPLGEPRVGGPIFVTEVQS